MSHGRNGLDVRSSVVLGTESELVEMIPNRLTVGLVFVPELVSGRIGQRLKIIAS